MQTITKMATLHTDYDEFFDFANKAEWILLTCVAVGDRATETWLTPAGRILRVTRTDKRVIGIQ